MEKTNKKLNKKTSRKSTKPAVISNEKVLENKEKLLDLQLKRVELREKKHLLQNWETHKIKDGEDKTAIDKINLLRWLLESITIDDSRTIVGSEPFFIRTFNEVEELKIKAKLFELIKTL